MPAFQELQALIRLIINGVIWGGEGEEGGLTCCTVLFSFNHSGASLTRATPLCPGAPNREGSMARWLRMLLKPLHT